MGQGKKRLLDLDKRWFDLSWLLMVGLGAASLRLSGHPITQAPWLSDALLSTALCVGFTLAVFVRRQEPASTRSDGVDVTPAVAIPVGIQLGRCEDEEIDTELEEEWHPISLRRSVAESHMAHRVLVWESVHLVNASLQERVREEVIATTKQVVEKYLASAHHAAAHRNLAREVVDIAKQLRGTGMEVKITQDQEIRICEARRLPFPEDEHNFEQRYHATPIN